METQRAFFLSHSGKKKQFSLCKATSVLLQIVADSNLSEFQVRFYPLQLSEEGVCIPAMALSHPSADNSCLVPNAEQVPPQPSIVLVVRVWPLSTSWWNNSWTFFPSMTDCPPLRGPTVYNTPLAPRAKHARGWTCDVIVPSNLPKSNLWKNFQWPS